MKKFFCLTAVLATIFILFSCSSTPKGACVIEGNVAMPEFGMMYLVDYDGTKIDSASREADGSFRFVYADSTVMPKIVVLEFRNPESEADVMYLPVALEIGQVDIVLDEYVDLSGTPLNDEISLFFDDLQAVSDGFSAEISTVEEMRKAYSAFYLGKMLENGDNVFGDYLKLAYARELTSEDLAILLGE